MSEDECISILLNHCTECDLREYSSCNECENKFKKAVQGLLDLYQKQKEKNSKIQKYIRSNEWAEDYKKSSCRTKILRILEE